MSRSSLCVCLKKSKTRDGQRAEAPKIVARISRNSSPAFIGGRGFLLTRFARHWRHPTQITCVCLEHKFTAFDRLLCKEIQFWPPHRAVTCARWSIARTQSAKHQRRAAAGG